MTRGWAVVALLPLVSACGASEPARPEAERATPRSVEATVITREPRSQAFESGGVVRAAVTAEIVSRIMAPVVARPVAAGQRVEAGAVLVVLDGRQQDAELSRAQAAQRAAAQAGEVASAGLARAEAQLAMAVRTHERMASLHAKKSGTDEELDRAKAGLEQARADVQATRAAVSQALAGLEAAQAAERTAGVGQSYTVLRAPFAGVVTDTRIDPGSMAVPGTPLVVVEEARRYRLEVRVDEARMTDVRVGALVPVRLGESGGGSVDGRVAEIDHVLDAAHTFLVKVDLPPAPSLRSGLFGTASFAGPARAMVVVPASSLVRHGQLTSVFVVVDGVARMRVVRPGTDLGDRVEVTAGLEPGDVVVSRPDGQVRDGTAVTTRAAQGEDTRP